MSMSSTEASNWVDLNMIVPLAFALTSQITASKFMLITAHYRAFPCLTPLLMVSDSAAFIWPRTLALSRFWLIHILVLSSISTNRFVYLHIEALLSQIHEIPFTSFELWDNSKDNLHLKKTNTSEFSFLKFVPWTRILQLIKNMTCGMYVNKHDEDYAVWKRLWTISLIR